LEGLAAVAEKVVAKAVAAVVAVVKVVALVEAGA